MNKPDPDDWSPTVIVAFAEDSTRTVRMQVCGDLSALSAAQWHRAAKAAEELARHWRARALKLAEEV